MLGRTKKIGASDALPLFNTGGQRTTTFITMRQISNTFYEYHIKALAGHERSLIVSYVKYAIKVASLSV